MKTFLLTLLAVTCFFLAQDARAADRWICTPQGCVRVSSPASTVTSQDQPCKCGLACACGDANAGFVSLGSNGGDSERTFKPIVRAKRIITAPVRFVRHLLGR